MALFKTTCCGLREFEGFSSFKEPEEVLQEIWKRWNEWNGAFVVMTCPTALAIRNKFVKFIQENKLGTITETDSRNSHLTGKPYRVIVWQVDRPAYIKWISGNKKKIAESVDSLIGRRVQGNERSNAFYNAFGEKYGLSFTGTIMATNGGFWLVQGDDGYSYHFVPYLLTVI